MKTIIATVAAAAAITAGVTVAGAQDLGGSSAGVSPYVGFEYTTTPTAATSTTAATWFGGDATSNVVVGVEAALPWDFTMDASLGMSNATDKFNATPANVDTSAFDFGGFNVDGVDITIAYEVMDGMSVYSTTEFGLATDGVVRESTSVGMMWKF